MTTQGRPAARITPSSSASPVPFGFTLIEVLVAAGILIVLSAIVTAVIVRAKDGALDESCRNNLRQIIQALHLYAGESDGWAPPYTTFKSGNGEGIQTPAQPKQWRDSLAPFSKSTEIFYCPRDSYRSAAFLSFDSTYTSYHAPASRAGGEFVLPGHFQLNVALSEHVSNPYITDQDWPTFRHGLPHWLVSLHGDKTTIAYLSGKVKTVPLMPGLP
jgi:type II secretory pathway pseudopilin PulG